jgi:hypothetical protein
VKRNTMRWFRSRIGFGACLALFALAVQLVLSFGHAHLDGLVRASSGPAAVADRALPGAPTNKPDGTTDRYCPICALVQLTASSLPALPPTLPLPANRDPIELPAPAEISSAPLLHFLFQARAPPSI